MKLAKMVSKLSLNLLSAELIRISFLIPLASWQVLQASNHSHRSFINLLQFFSIFFFEMQTLEWNKGSLFNCRLISVYFKSLLSPGFT